MKTLGRLMSALLLTIGMITSAMAIDPVSSSFFGKAIDGYDPVAYFTEGKAIEGSGEHATEWNGATWQFASADNLAAFTADPERFAPQYGGYCAYAVSKGYTAKTDPTAWHIEDGKLYLNYNHDVQALWKQDVPGNIAKGDVNWPSLLSQ